METGASTQSAAKAPQTEETQPVPAGPVTEEPAPVTVFACLPASLTSLACDISAPGQQAVERQVEIEPAGPTPEELAPASVTVRNMAGEVLTCLKPGPANIKALKQSIYAERGVAPNLQRFLWPGELSPLKNSDTLPAGEDVEVTLIVDNTAMYIWDIDNNPSQSVLSQSGQLLLCPSLQSDFVNVLTKEPLTNGVHYVRFVMHKIGDEQWCGLQKDISLAGPRTSGRYLDGWTYYCGRMRGWGSNDLRDGHGALHACGRAVAPFQTLRSEGDTIGMLVDRERNVVVFDLNGEMQGGCAIPSAVPLWISTHLDTRQDAVELVRLDASEAPEAALKLVSEGPLLDTAEGGVRLR